MLTLAPVFLIIALIIKLDSKGPIFFVQQRVGHNQKKFNLFKFRSMYLDNVKLGKYYTEKNDARITRSGKWLRASSLDEIPQLLNVFLGSMSLVGPRPDVPEQIDLYNITDLELRTSVKPGLTGLAQVVLRSEATFEQRKYYDLLYVAQQSLFFDIKILFMTVKQVITKGSY